jgi:hypothetical protein
MNSNPAPTTLQSTISPIPDALHEKIKIRHVGFNGEEALSRRRFEVRGRRGYLFFTEEMSLMRKVLFTFGRAFVSVIV